MIWLGIDPGVTGAVAAIYPEGSSRLFDLPITPDKRLHECGLRRILTDFHMPAAVAIEAMHARPGFDLRSQGELLRMAGAIGAVCRLGGFRVVEVNPQTWKRFYGLKADKRASVETAAVLFPDAGLSLVKDNNRAEALLIAHYARKKLQP